MTVMSFEMKVVEVVVVGGQVGGFFRCNVLSMRRVFDGIWG
jgi:hypothetical protein